MNNEQRKLRFFQFLVNINGFDNNYADEFLMDSNVDIFEIKRSIDHTGSIPSFGLDSVMMESGDYCLASNRQDIIW